MRSRIALGLAAASVVAAAVGAIGPAERERTTYYWQPAPSAHSPVLSYTPLLLAAQRPESIVASVPCAVPSPLADSDEALVLATTRRPGSDRGLRVTGSNDALTFVVGSRVLTRVPLDETGDPSCVYNVELRDSDWTIAGGPSATTEAGELETMPRVTGLFSNWRSVGAERPTIAVTTSPHATHPVLRQIIAWTLAVLTALSALLLTVTGGAHAGAHRSSESGKRPTTTLLWADAIVVLALLVWSMLSPAFFDDGWVLARQRAYSSSGGFTNYYTALAENLPNGYWLEWTQHWLAAATNNLLLLRIPAVLCLLTTWVLCRWVLTRVVPQPDATVIGALASSFVLASMAWGMTLRPEPVTALLATCVLACCVHFIERPTAPVVALVGVLLPLALTAHHTGVVALAPVVVATPALLRWARHHLSAAATITLSSMALITTLVFVGSDLRDRMNEVAVAKAYTYGLRDEFARYALLNTESWGTPVRRASVATLLLVVLAFVLRRERERRGMLEVPAPVLAIGLVLLVFTPSKWAWHFGAFIGIGAVAAAAETARLRYELARARSWVLWPFIAVAAVAAAGHWSWWVFEPWNAIDLRRLNWTLGVANTLGTLALLTPAFLTAGLILIRFRRRDVDSARAAPWRVASWAAAILALPGVLYTSSVLMLDSATAGSWTLARQTLHGISGNARCGLADDLLIPIPRSGTALSPRAGQALPATPAWVPPAPVLGLARFALSPAARGHGRSPWFEIAEQMPIGVYVAGWPARNDHLEIEWAREEDDRLRSIRSHEFTPVLGGPIPESSAWRFVVSEELDRDRPKNATAVRVRFRSGVRPGAAIAVTAPMTYRLEPIAERIGRSETRTLASPDLLTYFPCSTLPRLESGRVEVPHYLVTNEDPFPEALRRDGNPFLSLLDLYELERVPTADTRYNPDALALFRVHRRILGAREVAPVKTIREVG